MNLSMIADVLYTVGAVGFLMAMYFNYRAMRDYQRAADRYRAMLTDGCDACQD